MYTCFEAFYQLWYIFSLHLRCTRRRIHTSIDLSSHDTTSKLLRSANLRYFFPFQQMRPMPCLVLVCGFSSVFRRNVKKCELERLKMRHSLIIDASCSANTSAPGVYSLLFAHFYLQPQHAYCLNCAL